MSKKILIVTHAFYPENSPRSFRATELAKEFVKQGHLVTVITHPKIGTSDYCQQNGILFKDMGFLTWSTKVVKGNGVVSSIWRIFNRLCLFLFEYPFVQLVLLIKKSLKGESGYDLMISVAFPHPIHWGVAWANTKKKPIAKVWIADCGDPYMGNKNDNFKPPFYFGWVEKWFCRKADFLTVPTQNSINGYYSEFHHKIKVIPQGFQFDDVRLFKETISTTTIVFGYAGSFIPGRRDPSEFLNFLNNLDDTLKFEFHIYSTTPHVVTPFLAESRGRIQLKTLLPREELLYELSKMQFVVNFENGVGTETPSKLIDYLIIDKPVLSITFGNLQATVVTEFLQGNYANKMVLPDKNNYRIDKVAGQFLALLDK